MKFTVPIHAAGDGVDTIANDRVKLLSPTLDFACLRDSRMSDITDSTTVSLMHCTLSLTVCKCTPCQRASFNSTTDSFSWGHDRIHSCL